MPLVQRDFYSGVVLEKIYYPVGERVREPLKAKCKPPARTPAEQMEVAHRQSQLHFIRLVNANFSPRSWYFTGTFDDRHLPAGFEEAKRLLGNFFRRLRGACPGVLAVGVVGEGKWTGRLHVHCVIDGADMATIMDKWGYGEVSRLEHLREHNWYPDEEKQGEVDHGQDYTGLAIYLHNHWTPEQGGNRWLRTGKLKPYDREKPRLAKRVYGLENPPRAPKGYMLVGKKEMKGCCHFKYVRVPAHEPGVVFAIHSI